MPPIDEEHKISFDGVPYCVPSYKSDNLNGVTTDSDLGSLYAQERSKTVTLRCGGEGKQLPRYVEYQIEIQNQLQGQGQGQNSNDNSVTSVSTTDSRSINKWNRTTPASMSSTKSKSFFSRIRPPASQILIVKPKPKNLTGTGVTDKLKDTNMTTICVRANSSPTINIVVPPDNVIELVREAVKEWKMIEEGDCLLLGMILSTSLFVAPLSPLYFRRLFFHFSLFRSLRRYGFCYHAPYSARPPGNLYHDESPLRMSCTYFQVAYGMRYYYAILSI